MTDYLLEKAREEVAHRITMHCLTNSLNPVAFFENNKVEIQKQVNQEFEMLKELYEELKKNNH